MRPRCARPQAQERGAILIISSLIMMTMVALGSAMMVRSMIEQRSAQTSRAQACAFQAAEAGLDYAMTQLKANSNWTGASYTALPVGGYDVSATVLNSSTKSLTSAGYYPSNVATAYDYQRARIEAVVQQSPQSVFQYPLFGETSVELKKNTMTDSYDSSLGPYDPANPGQHGDVATNSIAAGSIALDKGTAVNGQVIVGPGLSDPSTAVDSDGSSVITGNPPIVSASNALVFSPVDVTGLDCSANLTLPKDATFTFAESGSPYCYNSIKADKNSVIAVTGNVVVYASTVDFDKNLSVNASGQPTQFILQIYGTSDVVIDKEGTFKGAIYAPQAKVRLKKAVDFYGALMAKDVTVDKESKFHYDEALKNANGPPGSYQVTIESWREL